MTGQVVFEFPLVLAIAVPLILGYLIAKLVYKMDIREHGSGNIGFTNIYRVLGFTPGAVVLAADIMKGWICTAGAALVLADAGPDFLHDAIPVAAGLAAVIGHTFSVFLRFQGGKGVATAAGVIVGLMPFVALVILLVWVGVLAATRYVSAASLSAAFVFPVVVYLTEEPTAHLVFAFVAALLVIVRHRANIGRLMRGEESRFVFKKDKGTDSGEGRAAGGSELD